MKINHIDPRLVSDIYTRRQEAQKPVSAAPQPGSAGPKEAADRVEISGAGRELQFYRARLKEMSDVRRERVAEIKRQLAEGTYRADTRRIAEGIMEERRLDRRV
ncbi:MAG: flagellar biosynthesis anti-sigma factor FlgM [Thermoanaerobacteraceae bacterium]|nr:flagellar biosynthesis anti-sigma factor FlgM [Thermoanaerobacteraceae bacterium]